MSTVYYNIASLLVLIKIILFVRQKTKGLVKTSPQLVLLREFESRTPCIPTIVGILPSEEKRVTINTKGERNLQSRPRAAD